MAEMTEMVGVNIFVCRDARVESLSRDLEGACSEEQAVQLKGTLVLQERDDTLFEADGLNLGNSFVHARGNPLLEASGNLQQKSLKPGWARSGLSVCSNVKLTL